MKESDSHKNNMFAGFRYDKSSASIVDKTGHSLNVRPQTVDVFRVLTESPDQLVTRDKLLAVVWPGIHVTDDSLTKCVSEIRKAIGDQKHEVLRTIPKRGYILVKDSQSPNSSIVADNTSADRSRWYERIRNNIKLIAVTSGMLLTAMLWIKHGNWSSDPIERQPSIAVIPFSTLTDEGRWHRMAEGLGSNILSELARNDWLRVYQFQSDDKLQQYIDDSHPIQFVLDGTFHGEDDALRITAKLKNIPSNEIIWSGHWQQPVGEFFSVQDEILGKIGNTIGSSWSSAVAQHSLEKARRRPTESLSAYEHYLLGNEHKHRFNEDDYQLAIGYLEQAVAVDPAFGKAWASLAIVHALRTDPTNTETGRLAILEDRLRATRKAIEADPDDPDVLIQLSWLAHHQGDSAGSERALRSAVKSAPNNADLLAQAAWAGPERADVAADAVQWAMRAIELNPGHPPWYLTGLLTAAFHAGDYQLVLDVADRAPETLGRLTYEAAAAVHLDDTARAHDVVRKILKLNPAFSIETYNNTDPIRNEKVREMFQTGLRKAGLPQLNQHSADKIKDAG